MVGTVGAIVITVVVLAAVAGIAWVVYSRWRAQKLGLPPPSFTSFIPFHNKSDTSAYNPGPRAGGIQGWFSDQARKFKNRNNRTAAGAYEGAPGASNTRSRGGFGPLDPDEAWDARVGNEADHFGGPGGYYEEQELGLHSSSNINNNNSSSGPYGRGVGGDTAYHGGSGLGADSYSMNLAATPRMGPEDGERGRAARNPFDDDAEPSNIDLRGVSPRPMDGEHHAHGAKGGRDSPTDRAERRSIFTEDV